jgi:predicted alpha/beta hydrolase family esterase
MITCFTSNVFIVPGLGNSGLLHWQSIWEEKFSFNRIVQHDWDTPECEEWVSVIISAIIPYDPSTVLLVGHSLACSTIAYWAQKYQIEIKGALLVGPSDTEAATYPDCTTGFQPIPLLKLPFPSIVVASENDYFVSFERSRQFGSAWGSELVNIGQAGHINVATGFGEWEEGVKLLSKLDE